ncbi:uncharacterized protein LOC135682911 isoform X3 [Rhopilema esculentum]|uniref:uncharacterized protein LOC135682911 isoform X3 n=1 Tax=Rhopilema esculentum TaxID=499914 RepID=UPI0031D6CADB
MYYKAIVGSPGTERARDNLKDGSTLGRLDSGIEFDLGLSTSSPNKSVFHDNFLNVLKGDVFKSIEIPVDKRLIYVERVSREKSNEDGDSVFGFEVDMDESAAVAKGYILADSVEICEPVNDSNNNGGKNTSCCHYMECSCGTEFTKRQEAIIKELTNENKRLRAQLQELRLTNDGLLDSLSWNGGEEQVSLSLSIPASPRPVSPRMWKSPRPLRARSGTARSDCSDPDVDVFLKMLEKPLEKQEDILEEEIQLSCTLCSRKINLTELEVHSKICSSVAANKNAIPSLPNMLVVDVTQVTEASNTEQLVKVITKTTLKSYDGHLFKVNRSIEDFVWFRGILQVICASRIVPSIRLHDSASGNFREIQRFLGRLTNHKVLKSHDFVRDFLTKKDLDSMRKRYADKGSRLATPNRKPKSNHPEENSLLFRAFSYITILMTNLENLACHFKERMERKSVQGDGVSRRFSDLSDGEINETYLKIACSGLSRITQETGIKKEDSHEAALVEEIESLLGNVKEAENLLKRIEAKRDNFLYWNEQMTLYEQQNLSNQCCCEPIGKLPLESKNELDTPSRKTSMTQKWAEASANCEASKTSLENICKHLSEELQNFDISKELDLKELLIDFADGNFQHYEKLQSKWYGVRIMLDAEISPNKRAFNII